MSDIKKLLSNIKRIKEDLKKLNSVSDLILYIKIADITKITLIVLLIWVNVPIILMLRSTLLFVFCDYDFLMRSLDLGISWYVFLQQLGYLGFIIFIFVTIKTYNNLKINNLSYLNFIKANQIELLLIFMFIWSIISTLLSSDKNISVNGTFYRHDGLNSYIAYVGFFTCGYYINSESSIKKILNVFVLSATIIAILVLLDVNTLNDIFSFNKNSAIFYNINHYGYYLCMTIMSSVFLFLVNNANKKIKIRYLICYIVLTATLVKNGSFGPYLASLIGLFVLSIIIYFNFRNYFNDIAIIFILFWITSFLMNIFSDFLNFEIYKLFKGVQDIVKNTDSSKEAGSGRWILWKNGIKYIFEKPFFGYGPDNLGYRYMQDGIQLDRPHNEFIQIAASLGIPALVFYVVALFKQFKLIINNIDKVDISVVSLNTIIFTYLVSSFFGNTMFYTSPFYFMILGMSVRNTKCSIYEK